MGITIRSGSHAFALPLLMLAACSTPSTQDSGPADGPADAGSMRDSQSDDASDSSSMDSAIDDGSSDGSIVPDASAAGPALLLVGLTGRRNANGASFSRGAWSTATPLGAGVREIDLNAAVLTNGRGIGTTVDADAGTVSSAPWTSGTWTTLTPSPFVATHVGIPLADSSGVTFPMRLAHSGVNGERLALARYDGASSTWQSTPDTPGIGSSTSYQLAGAPSLAIAGTADPVVAYGVVTPSGASIMSAYGFTRRSGGTWSPPATIPGSTGAGPDNSEIQIVRRATADEIVAVWATGSSFATGLQSSVYRDGAWSTPTQIAGDFRGSWSRSFMLAPMADDRIALVYRAALPSGGPMVMRFGFFDGTSWSTLNPVPGATVDSLSSMPLAVARGVDAGARLELVWVDPMGHLHHMRLVDAATGTWSSAVDIDAATTYVSVAVTSGAF